MHCGHALLHANKESTFRGRLHVAKGAHAHTAVVMSLFFWLKKEGGLISGLWIGGGGRMNAIEVDNHAVNGSLPECISPPPSLLHLCVSKINYSTLHCNCGSYVIFWSCCWWEVQCFFVVRQRQLVVSNPAKCSEVYPWRVSHLNTCTVRATKLPFQLELLQWDNVAYSNLMRSWEIVESQKFKTTVFHNLYTDV